MELELNDFVNYLLIGICVLLPTVILLDVVTNQTQNTEANIISIKPDTQITYSQITFQVDNQTIFTKDISCTGNFQFQVGQSVAVNESQNIYGVIYPWNLRGLPAGCIELK